MKPKAKPVDNDPFDLGFDADDEFTAPPNAQDAWRETPLDDDDPGTPHPDPFVGLPRAADPEPEAELVQFGPPPAIDGADVPEPFAGLPQLPDEVPDPFADLPKSNPRPDAADLDFEAEFAETPEAPINPVGDLIAAAAAALGEPVVPRITVHAFCAREDIAELVRSAAGDRRMERASTVVRSGGLTAAVEYYQNQPTPSLVIVEASEPTQLMLSLLDTLAEHCDPGTKVIVIGQHNDIALYRELIRRGVSEYLVPPLKTLQLIGAITTLYADPSAPFIGRQIAFCGAKGGSGSSTLAHNVAYEISERMAAGTVIVDLDLAFGTAGLNFNHDPLQGIVDALSQPDRLDTVLMDRMMARPSDHLSLFAAPATLEQDYEIGSDVFEEVIQKIRAASPYVVLDLPHAWTVWKRRMLLTSDDLVIVAEPDLASLRNAKNILDLVRAARPNDTPPKVVLNKVGVPGRPEIPLKDFTEALGVSPSLIIPFDAKTFGQAANNGQMVTEVGGKTKAGEAIDQLTRMMLNQREAAPSSAAKTSVLSSLFKKK
jgi:pilus assembly protein CpaE